MALRQKSINYPLFSWALYDFANSAFAVTVMSGFFPLFFKQYWAQNIPLTTSTFYLGIGNSIASLILVFAAPILGALADRGSYPKRMLASFASLGCIVCVGLFFVSNGMWQIAILLYVLGVIGFSGANVVYDALLVVVSPENSRHRDSALGYSLGYLGGGLLFFINVFMTLKPELFGLASKTDAVRWSFVSVAVWWALFTLPLLSITLSEKEKQPDPNSTSHLFRDSLRSLKTTVSAIRQYKNIGLFLLAYWLYIDGVITVIKMGVDYGIAIGLPTNGLIVALLAVQFIGFPATLLFGKLAHERGPLKCLWIALWAYVCATVFAFFMTAAWQFYVLAGVIGLVQGAVQAISRSLYSQLIPTNKSGEFFGYYNVMGKAAAVLGPVMVGTISVLTNDSRLGFLSIIILFISGMLVLRLVSFRNV